MLEMVIIISLVTYCNLVTNIINNNLSINSLYERHNNDILEGRICYNYKAWTKMKFAYKTMFVELSTMMSKFGQFIPFSSYIYIPNAWSISMKIAKLWNKLSSQYDKIILILFTCLYDDACYISFSYYDWNS